MTDPKRYRLLARAQIAGAVRDPGFIFTLNEGEKGPTRTVVASDHGANHDGAPGDMREEPLYVEYVEPKAEPEPEEDAPDETEADA